MSEAGVRALNPLLLWIRTKRSRSSGRCPMSAPWIVSKLKFCQMCKTPETRNFCTCVSFRGGGGQNFFGAPVQAPPAGSPTLIGAPPSPGSGALRRGPPHLRLPPPEKTRRRHNPDQSRRVSRHVTTTPQFVRHQTQRLSGCRGDAALHGSPRREDAERDCACVSRPHQSEAALSLETNLEQEKHRRPQF